MFQQASEYLSKLFFFFNTMKKVLKAIRENRLEKEAVLHGGGQGKLCWEGGFEQKLKQNKGGVSEVHRSYGFFRIWKLKKDYK